MGRFVQLTIAHFFVDRAQVVQECLVDSLVLERVEKEAGLAELGLRGEVFQVDQRLLKAHTA